MTKNSEFRIAVGLLTLLLTLGILFGGYSVFTVYGIEKPAEKSLTSVEYVSAVSIEKENNIYNIRVKLEPVENLQKTYSNLQQAASQRLAADSYILHITDNRNQRLDQLYTELQPGVQQALARHEFVWLDSELRQKTDELGIEYQLMVDENNIYIHLTDGNFYLYEIVARPDLNNQTM